MERLFVDIDKTLYDIYPQTLEEYAEEHDRKYDFVVAEGFIYNCPNANSIFHKLLTLVKTGGVIVLTCIDCVGFFVEYLKRLSALALIKDICDYDCRVEYLTRLFEPQLESLVGVSRPASDWVQDNILNPAGRGAVLWGLDDLLNTLPEGFHVLGSSPQLFTDISWYKDARYPDIGDLRQQLRRKHATLLLAGSEEICLEDYQEDKLEDGIRKIIKHGLEFEEKGNIDSFTSIVQSLIELEDVAKDISEEFLAVIREAGICFSFLAKAEKIDYTDYPHFFKAFGRELNYIALQRDMEYGTVNHPSL